MKIFIGYDSREDIAYQVCRHSILSRNPSAEIIPLKRQELIEEGLYTREVDPLSSTEFTFTRFLVPHLMNYEGWALFCDCDFLFTVNIDEIFNCADNQFAVMVVKHDYKPKEGVKMDGQKQLPYPRKNWSSLMLWNCGHPSNQKLTLNKVNNKSGAFLHRFQWLDDKEIGDLPHVYNWLVNWYQEPKDGSPKVIHYTEGGPWFENYRHCEYGYHWLQELHEYQKSTIGEKQPGPFDYIPPDISNLFKKILHYRVDSDQEYYSDCKFENIVEDLKMINEDKVYAIDGGWNPEEKKGLLYDSYMEAFVLGSGGKITHYEKVENSKVPCLFRGITKMKHMRACEEAGRDYYYIDTGYFGNIRKKLYHRITKNAMQNVGPVIERPHDRLETIGWQRSKFRPGRNILLCPPSAKAMSCFGLDLDQWMEETIATIKKYTDRPIVIRKKLSRRERSTTDTIEMALKENVHCLVTYNSIAASEALLNGKPAFTLGPNAAHTLCHSDLSQIEKPYIPDADELIAWAAHLSYCQFTELEMRDGTAWRILNDH